jgi:hypothetical protein
LPAQRTQFRIQNGQINFRQFIFEGTVDIQLLDAFLERFNPFGFGFGILHAISSMPFSSSSHRQNAAKFSLSVRAYSIPVTLPVFRLTVTTAGTV